MVMYPNKIYVHFTNDVVMNFSFSFVCFDLNTLCRCTGMRPILCGMKTFAKDHNQKELSQTPDLIMYTPSPSSLGELAPAKNIAVIASATVCRFSEYS